MNNYVVFKNHIFTEENKVYFADSIQDARDLVADLQIDDAQAGVENEWIIAVIIS